MKYIIFAMFSIAKNTAIFNFEMISALVKALNEAQIAPTYCNISHGIKLAVVTTLSTISALDAEFCKLIEQAEATEILFSIACKFNIGTFFYFIENKGFLIQIKVTFLKNI